MGSRFFTMLIVVAVIGFSGSSCQRFTKESSDLPATVPQNLKPESAEKTAEQFLTALEKNNFTEIKQYTCQQEVDLTRLAPIGIKEWSIQQVSDQIDHIDTQSKYSVVLVNIESEISTQPWSLKVWESETFFAYDRRSTEAINRLTSRFNEINAKLGSSPKPLEKLPSRKDISLTPYCVEIIVHPDSPRVKP